MARSEALRPTAEITIVSLPPSRAAHTFAGVRKLNPSLLQVEEKRNWRGTRVDFCGRPQGLQAHTSPSPEDARFQELLSSLECPTPLPPLVQFHPSQSKEAIFERATLAEQLHYKLYKSEGRLVRTVLEQAGFAATDSYDWDLLWAGAAPPAGLYSGLLPHQKINHFPGSFQLTQKDLMYRQVSKAQTLFGKPAFDFVPETFLLPSEFQEFVHRFEAAPDLHWIAKPNASSQGKGVFLVERLDQLPLTEPYVVSLYLSSPFLIHNLKFDMRIYVLVTSYEPLRIYLYEEGLARFASEEYTGLTRKDARCMHLTNYSVNKRSDNYVPNSDYRRDNVGHKWSLTALFKHLETIGADTDFLWTKIYDLIVKAVVAVQEEVVEACTDLGLTAGHCFDLFGFDVLLDNALKPWLLEVNLSPSLATDSSLDLFLKTNLLIDTFNLVGVQRPERKYRPAKSSIRQNRSKGRSMSKLPSHLSMSRIASREPEQSLSRLKELLRTTLQEYERRGHYIRIYPSKGTDHYDQFLGVGQSIAKWLYQALYENRSLESSSDWLGDLPREPFRAKAGISVRRLMSRTAIKRAVTAMCADKSFSSLPKSDKLMVTGDDILLEYISRLIKALVAVQEDSLTPMLRKSIEAFISHPVWKGSNKGPLRDSLRHRLEVRFAEMQLRRLRVTECEARVKGGFRENPLLEDQRKAVVREFSPGQLEAMLKVSTRSLARDVVQPLLNHRGVGVLSDLQAWLAKTQTSEEEDCSTVSPALSIPAYRARSTFKSIRIANLYS